MHARALSCSQFSRAFVSNISHSDYGKGELRKSGFTPNSTPTHSVPGAGPVPCCSESPQSPGLLLRNRCCQCVRSEQHLVLWAGSALAAGLLASCGTILWWKRDENYLPTVISALLCTLTLFLISNREVIGTALGRKKKAVCFHVS